MRAALRTVYGDSSVLHVGDVPVPRAEPGRVVVEVRAAGINMAEWHLMTGEPRLVRVFVGWPRPRTTGLGEDVAGVVTAVGDGVDNVAVGDEVFGSGRATWAEFASVRGDLLQPIPAGISFEQAAAVPLSGYTALQALRLCGSLDRRHVAVTGAGGGVGSAVVQLASARGARVTAICSGAKASFVHRLGAHDVIDYTTTDPTAGTHHFDAVLDFAGSLPISRWKRALKPGGLLVLGGGEGGGRMLGPLSRSLRAPFIRGIRVVTLMASSTASDLAELAGALATGELRATVAETMPLADAGRALEALRAATYAGKIVLVP